MSWAWVLSQISSVTYLCFDLKDFAFPQDLSGWQWSITAFLLMRSAVTIQTNINTVCKFRWNLVWELYVASWEKYFSGRNIQCISGNLFDPIDVQDTQCFSPSLRTRDAVCSTIAWCTGWGSAMGAWWVWESFCQGRTDDKIINDQYKVCTFSIHCLGSYLSFLIST